MKGSYHFLLEIIHLKWNKTLIKRNNFDIVFYEILWVVHTLLVLNKFFLRPVLSDVSSLEIGIT